MLFSGGVDFWCGGIKIWRGGFFPGGEEGMSKFSAGVGDFPPSPPLKKPCDIKIKVEAKDRQGKSRRQKRKKQKIIRYEKTKIKKIYVLFREQITAKERKEKTRELRFARYICAGAISSRHPSEGSQGSQVFVRQVAAIY